MDYISQWYRNWFLNERCYDAWAHSHGYNYTELFILYTIYTTGGCTPTHIANFLSVSKQTVNTALRHFEQQNMLLTIPSPNDKRSCLVMLKPGEATKAEEMLDDLARLENRAFARMGEENARRMIELDQILTENILLEMQEEKAE